MPQTWTSFVRDNDAALRNKEKEANETTLCSHCGCKYFVQIDVEQFRANYNNIVGQKVPTIPNSAVPFKLLQCVRCGDYIEPNVDTDFNHNVAAMGYDSFLDELEGKGDLREKQEDTKTQEDTILKLEQRVASLEEALEKALEELKPKNKNKK